jgi:DNA-binding NtrC family response regulator
MNGEHKPNPEKTVLCVDDDKTTVEMITNYLIDQGYKTFTAFSAKEALEVLSKHHIDLVMTDVVMPRMDGLELTKIIKETYDSDVIIFTGYKPICSYEKAFSLGASDFFYKPFKFEDLLDSIRRILGASE